MAIKSFIFHVEHRGELAAGIRPFTERVTITLENGIPQNGGTDFVEMWRATIAEWFDGAEVYTDAEYQSLVASQNESYDYEDHVHGTMLDEISHRGLPRLTDATPDDLKSVGMWPKENSPHEQDS